MPAVTPGVSTFLVLGTGAPTQVAGPNDQRRYILITNNDKVNAAAIAFGTNNGATANHHVIQGGGWFEYLERPGWTNPGDVSAIAVSGTPTLSYLEL